MAEVLGVVASGVSVVQIAGQLLNCIQGLRLLCRALRDTPGELQGILDELEILGEIFYQLGAIQTGTSQPGHSALQASLIHCRKAATKLENLASQDSRPLQKGKHTAWFRVKAVLKLEEVRDLKIQLEAAKSLLHLAMTCFSLNMHQNHIKLLEVHNTEVDRVPLQRAKDQAEHRLDIVSPADTRMVQIELSQRQRTIQRSKCSPGKCYCSCHNSSTISGKLWTLRVPHDWNPCDKKTCDNYKHTSLWFSLTGIGIPYVIRASLDVLWTFNQSYISPSLQVTRVVDWNSPAFALLVDIKWNEMTYEEARDGMVKLFDSRAASPLDILPNGKSLPETLLNLPWIDGDTQLKLLELFVIFGSPLNSDGILRCCSGWKGLGTWNTGLGDKTAAHTNLLRHLVNLGLDPSKTPTLEEWPEEISPMPQGYYDMDDDSFFIDWISEGLKISPGFAGSSPLQEAILIGSAEAVQSHLRDSHAPEDDNVLAQSPLHLAVWRPQHLQSLLLAGFDVNARDCNGRTPLMYAAAAGMRDVAVSLVQAGADIWTKDILHSRHTWLEYATISTHWSLVLDVIDVVRQSTRFSPEEVQNLLNAAIKNWANTSSKARSSSHFATLLKWGADPEIRFGAKWPNYKATSTTLLHCIENSTDFDTLIRAGFRSFNHANSRGFHPLMAQIGVGNADLIQKSINAGSQVNHQDFDGDTALHLCAEFIRSGITSINPDEYTFRFRTLEIVQLILANGADPFLGDDCRCPCSTSGCTPAGMLLKDFHHKVGSDTHRSYPLTMHSWVNEWFLLLKGAEKDFEHTGRFYLDVIRLSRFEQLELTHTCCRFTNHEHRIWDNLEDEDVEEIRDEEQELSDTLESEMSTFQSCSIAELEALWLKEMDKLMQLQGNNFVCVGEPLLDLGSCL